MDEPAIIALKSDTLRIAPIRTHMSVVFQKLGLFAEEYRRAPEQSIELTQQMISSEQPDYRLTAQQEPGFYKRQPTACIGQDGCGSAFLHGQVVFEFSDHEITHAENGADPSWNDDLSIISSCAGCGDNISGEWCHEDIFRINRYHAVWTTNGLTRCTGPGQGSSSPKALRAGDPFETAQGSLVSVSA